MRQVMNSGRKGLAIVSIALLGAIPISASANGFFAGFDAGWADADFGEAIFSNGDGIGPGGDDAVLAGGLFAGYEWSNNWFVEARLAGYQNLTVAILADSLELDALNTSVGYYLPGDSKFRVFGKAGLNFWQLEARESIVFNPGDEERRSLDGTDYFAELGLEYRFRENIRAGIALSYTDFDVGSVTALKLTFKFLP